MAITINGNGTVTGISVGGLPDGIVDTDMLAANAVTAAKASGSAKGITEADQWRLTSNFTGNGSYLTSNWERNDTSFQLIGSGMTNSSGVFSFPTTGIYLIIASTRGNGGGNAAYYAGIQIDATVNSGTNYVNIGDGYANTSATNGYFDATAIAIFDVPNVSTHKFKIYVAAAANVNFSGDSGVQMTGFTVIKLGDT